MTEANQSNQADWLSQVTWNDQGLVAVIAQEADTGDVLMMAWMNHESLKLTLEKVRRFIGLVLERRFGTRAKSLVTSKLSRVFI